MVRGFHTIPIHPSFFSDFRDILRVGKGLRCFWTGMLIKAKSQRLIFGAKVVL